MASLVRLQRSSCNSLSAFATKSALLSTLPRPSSRLSSPASAFLLGGLAKSSWGATCRTAATATFDTVAWRSTMRNFGQWPNHRSRIVHSHARAFLRILHLREWDAALELELRQASVSLTFYIVDQVVACIPCPKLALQFFIWAGEQIGYPQSISYAACTIIQWYAHKSQIICFLNILRGLQNPHFSLSPSRVNVLLQGYGWAGMVDRAYNVMSRKQGFANDMLVNCFLFSIMRELRYDMVYNVYLEMKQWGTPLDVCYNALIQGMSLSGGDRWQEADHLYKKMVDSGQLPDGATCNVLVQSLSKAGKHERVYELLQDMFSKKIKLESTTASVLVERLCHAKQLQTASRLIEQLKQGGYVVDPKVYNSFLGAF